MGNIIVTEFISLDGVMQAPGPDGSGFKYEGWTFDFNRGEAGDKFKLEETMATEALLLGRRTYEGFAQAWPKMEGEFADKFNSMPKYVVSSTLEKGDWTNSHILSGDMVEEVTKLKESTEGTLMVHGSGQLVQGLLEHSLVDGLNLMIFPIILGQGKRLFGDASHKQAFKLARAETFGEGIELLMYERVTNERKSA